MKRKGAVDQAKLDELQRRIIERFDSQMSVFTTSALPARRRRDRPARHARRARRGARDLPRGRAAHGRRRCSSRWRGREPCSRRPSTPFRKILIANRGEIALRVMRSARALGYRTVAVYSDRRCRRAHVQEADQAVCIGEPLPAQSYLRIAGHHRGRAASGADAVHPGYGFLAENADFAQACRDAGLVFIGPSPEAIAAMGHKAGAKTLMQAAGVPCIPGYQGDDQSDARLAARGRAHRLPGDDQGRRPAAAAAACGWCRRPTSSPALLRSARSEALQRLRRRRGDPRARDRRRRATSRSRSSPTATAMPSTSASATARCSAATRS